MGQELVKGEIALSVVLPAYMEEENLRLLLPRMKRVLEGLGVPYEVVVVDTMAPMDQTRDACEQSGARYVPRRGGNTFGDAVITGIEEALGRKVIFMDADGSHAPEFIPQLWAHRDTHDIVIASRYIEGGTTENSLPLLLMSKVLNITYGILLNLKCKDVSNSFKLYRADLLKPLQLRCHNFDIVEEILFKISYLNPGIRIKEVPFTFKKRMFGDTKRNLVVFILTYIWTIARLRLSVLPLVRNRGRQRIQSTQSTR